MPNEKKDRQRFEKIEAREIHRGAKQEAKEEKPSKPKGKVALWFENYWYYYKFHTIVAVFILFVLTVCFVQCANKETGDLTVTFAGSYALSGEERENFMDAVNAVAPKDEESGKKLSVSLSSYAIFTEEELRAMYIDPETGALNSGYYQAKQYNTEQLEAFSTFLKTGESPILFINSFVFEEQNISEIAMPLKDLYGEELPASACNAYAVRLGDTDFYRYYAAVQVLPADTLVVLAKPYYMGATSKEEVYERYEALFHAIVDFQAP